MSPEPPANDSPAESDSNTTPSAAPTKPPRVIETALAAAFIALLMGGTGGLLISQAFFMPPPPEVAADAEEDEGGGGGFPASVVLNTVKIESIQNRIQLVGRLEEVRRATVASEVEGRVIAMKVDEGDLVVAGETVLAQIDEDFAKLDLAAAKAEQARAEAELERAQNDLRQLEQLAQAQSAKRKEVDDARTEVATRQAELDAAIARKERIEEQVERLIVLAPFDGVVVTKHTEVGQWLEIGSEVVEIVSRGEIDAVINVPENSINEVQLGESVQLQIDPLNKLVAGNVVKINPNGDNAARTFRVAVRIPNAEEQGLKVGMSITAFVSVGEVRDHITVPRDAVVFGNQSNRVWLALPPAPPPASQASGGDTSGDSGGPPPMPSAMPAEVNVLFAYQDRFAIEPIPGPFAGMFNDGMQVVVQGSERLYPTQPLIAQ